MCAYIASDCEIDDMHTQESGKNRLTSTTKATGSPRNYASIVSHVDEAQARAVGKAHKHSHVFVLQKELVLV